MTDQTISQNGLSLIKNFEGCRLVAYRDAGGIPTIGYGHTSSAGAPAVHDGLQITQAEADVILSNDLEKFEAIVRSHVQVKVTQNQFDALTSFVYNLGEPNFEKSTLLRDVNAQNFTGAKAEFARWTRANGVVLAGLVRRRAAEAALFGTPDVSVPVKTTTPAVPASAIPASPPAAPALAPTTSGPSSAPVSVPITTEPATGVLSMNAISIILAALGAFKTYAPLIPAVIDEIPTVVKDIETAIADIKKLDVSATILDVEKIITDVGVPLHLIVNTVSATPTLAAVAPASSAPAAAAAATVKS